MTAFFVFRDLPGISRDQYRAAQGAIGDVLRQPGQAAVFRYRGGFFLPALGRAICAFDADSAASLAAANEQAGVPFTQIAEVIEMPGPAPEPSAGAADQGGIP